MPASAARSAAFDILLAVEKKGAYASELLHSQSYAKLSPVDHGLATEIVMGVLRWRSLLDSEITAHSSHDLAKLDAEVLIALRMGSYQLRFLERVPARAAVHESVELIKRARKRSAAPFANAVLRKIQKESRVAADIPESKTAEDLATASAHPAWLVDRWAQRFGFDAARAICQHDQRVPETAIHLADDSSGKDLLVEGIELASGRLLASARSVKSGDITKTRTFLAGRVAIQDEASQLIALLVGKGTQILDCCAAPGGKTRVLAERNPQAKILALELHPHRARLLKKMVPHKHVEVVTADAVHFSSDRQFDRILVDAPCSGTGTLARNPEIKWRLTAADLQDLQSRQRAILQAAMKQLAPGGKLVYSTCSLEDEENSTVVEGALSQHPTFRLMDCSEELRRLKDERELVWPDLASLLHGPYLRTIPGVHPCDGFFAAVLTRS
ncbi:MAG TPA: 16S rRNA (cytosine(967)-C(5))-methyltransferase RsmB [Terriglobales bacterium]|jgi:16S rRNA (cytosine967-C5)-methyltransferase